MQNIVHLIFHYGYLLVLFGVMAESIGVPLPGETILISAGILVQRGDLDLGDAIFFGILGAVVGDQIGYWIGRKGGRPFVLRYGRYVFITPERLGRAEAFFARHGGKAVFMARFFSGLRVFGALVAGMSRMRWVTFFVYNALGGAVWATVAVLVGYSLGRSLGLVERWTGRASVLLFVLAVLALVLYLAYRWVLRHPERVKSVFERVGGRRVYAVLESPAGLWLRRRLSPNGVYGLSLTVGLVLTGLFSWAFGAVVQDIVARDPLVSTDLAVLRFFHSYGEPYLTASVTVLEAVFSPEVLLSTAALAGFALLFLARRLRDFETGLAGAVLLATAFGTGALAELFKILFHRPRPPASLQLMHETGYGFPSSHAVAVVAVGAAVWYLFGLRPLVRWGGSWRERSRVGLVVVALALLVGFGRVYTGAHYPSDVLAGWALGGVWASFCLTAAEVFRRLRAEGKPLPQAGVRYARFSLVGVSNALVDLGAINLLLFIHPTREPWLLVLFNLLALALTNANSYLWNTLWTFRHQARHDARQMGLFTLQGVMNAALASGVLWGVAHLLLAYYPALSAQLAGNIAKVASMFIASSASFLFLHFLVFNKKGR
jgi:membrane protein DedA with SNARE-associated domain/membrane-associated phospholipid phosphatase/putative flippase GtrA